MVASMVFSSTTTMFCEHRNSVYLSNNVSHLKKGIMSFTYYLPCQKSSLKLCKMPAKASFPHHSSSRYVIGCAINVDGSNRKGDVSSDVHIPKKVKSMNDIERQLDSLFSEVKTLVCLGKKRDAVDLLEANYLAVKKQMDAGFKGIEEAAILDVIALGYMTVNDSGAVKSLLTVLNEVVEGLKEDEHFLDSILIHMGNMYEKLEKYELAIHQYRRALDITEKKYGKHALSPDGFVGCLSEICGVKVAIVRTDTGSTSSFLVSPMLGMAKALGSNKKLTEAVNVYHQVIKLLEHKKGILCEELVFPLFALGKLLLKEGKVSEAETSFERILNLYTRLYGEKDGRVGTAMCSLAHVKCATGSVNEAIDLYKDAFKVIKETKFVELDDRLLEKIRLDLAELLHVTGRGEEGRVLLEECMLITEKYLGKDHPSYAIQLMNLATSYSQAKNYAEAEHFLRRSLQIMTKTAPPDDQSITYPMLHLAVTLYNLNRDEEAENFALKALHVREKAFGPKSLPVGEVLDCLICIQTRLERNDRDILALLKRLLSIQELAFGHESEEVVETLKKVVHFLDKLGMKSEKFPVQRRLSGLRSKFKEMVNY